MPDLPQPYLMRDWKQVTLGYDAFVFNPSKTGDHLPLVKFAPTGINFPSLQPILLDTYVGTTSNNQAEAINIIPAIVGASLIGVDKSSQGGINWVQKIKDFYNSKNGENVYLNGYNSSSGNDWWYDVMPNVFFYQLSTLYPLDTDFQQQFLTVADRWLNAVKTMGGNATPWTKPNMNYRGWYLSDMTPNANGVREPEAAGAIGWLLYHAYTKTGDKKYLEGAQMCLEFLSQLSTNPSYELQLPYGTLVAAKMNAIVGTNYDLDKMLNWSFDRGALRGWGTIIGKWDGKDVSGLVGEANDQGNDYAFMMNGFQQAAALAPVMKYDKRYAKALSKWILNLANASRFFYSDYLDASKQDDATWSTEYDPNSFIGYEALKENLNGSALYGTGDAKRNGWAATNFALYGSSHVGYLAAVIDKTDVEGILRINLNATDFFGDPTFPSYAYYNPYDYAKEITIQLDPGTYQIYDAIAEKVIAQNISGNYKVSLKAGEVTLLVVLPFDAILTASGNRLYSSGHVVDFHYHDDYQPSLRIKSLATGTDKVEFNNTVKIYATVENTQGDVSYQWFVDEAEATATTDVFDFTAPSQEGLKKILLKVTSGGVTVKDSLYISVLEHIPKPPTILSIQQSGLWYEVQAQVSFILKTAEAGLQKLNYEWSATSGIVTQQDSLLHWQAPAVPGLYTVSCKVTNTEGLSASRTISLLVKDNTLPDIDPLAYYPFDVNANDYSGHDFHAQVIGAKKAPDARGHPSKAYSISSGDDMIKVPPTLSLNFVDQITVSCWISAGQNSHEAFILSHGSWEERWKLSITPEGRIRWTVKTQSGVKDLDSSFPIVSNHFYHITVSYTGYSLELYIDGVLDSFIGHKGSMGTTNHSLTMGQKSEDETQYFLNGIIDEVKIFNHALQPSQIAGLKDQWTEDNVTATEDQQFRQDNVFPNPTSDKFLLLSLPAVEVKDIYLLSTDGKKIPVAVQGEERGTKVSWEENIQGLFILCITTESAFKYYKIILN
jgi:hypothetical protein